MICFGLLKMLFNLEILCKKEIFEFLGRGICKGWFKDLRQFLYSLKNEFPTCFFASLLIFLFRIYWGRYLFDRWAIAEISLGMVHSTEFIHKLA